MTHRPALACIGVVFVLALAGCGQDVPQPQSADVPPAGAPVGQAVELDENIEVTLVSIDASTPPQGPETAENSKNGPWLEFDVRNASESTVTLPSRPVRPTLIDADGQALKIPSITAGLTHGGGGWGPAAAHRGVPYLSPGGSMRVFCLVPELKDVAGPVVISYAPTRDRALTFVVQ